MDKADITEDRIIKDMVGRDMDDRYPPRTPKIGETLLRGEELDRLPPEHPDRQIIKNVAFTCARARSSASPA
jgi:putative multiple sugar transport system ATP-binding protein